MVGVARRYAGPAPLRLRQLAIAAGDRSVISGLDRGAAEMFVLLVTGAVLPEEGVVRIEGRDTRAITTDTAWLSSLDRFGIVTERAVLIERLSIQANLALPLTLSIDPLAADVRAKVEGLADEVRIAGGRLAAPASSLSAEERVRVHLARALALGPAMLLLEHPTAGLSAPAARLAFGDTVREVAERRGLGWVALSDDEVFARGSRGSRQRLIPATGEVAREPLWRRVAAGLRRRSG
jgi:ABC-type lipoprotein export system ATPase subunit